MLFRTLSAAVYGINANLVDIEVEHNPSSWRKRTGEFGHHRWFARRRRTRIS